MDKEKIKSIFRKVYEVLKVLFKIALIIVALIIAFSLLNNSCFSNDKRTAYADTAYSESEYSRFSLPDSLQNEFTFNGAHYVNSVNNDSEGSTFICKLTAEISTSDGSNYLLYNSTINNITTSSSYNGWYIEGKSSSNDPFSYTVTYINILSIYVNPNLEALTLGDLYQLFNANSSTYLTSEYDNFDCNPFLLLTDTSVCRLYLKFPSSYDRYSDFSIRVTNLTSNLDLIYTNIKDSFISENSYYSGYVTILSLSSFDTSTTFYINFTVDDGNYSSELYLNYIVIPSSGSGSGSDYQAGFDAGYKAGYTNGHTDGYNIGYDKGYEQGEIDGSEAGSEAGYDLGYNDGYYDGYDKGFDEGVISGGGQPVTVLTEFIQPIDTFLSTPFLNGFSIGQVFGVIIFVWVAMIFLKMFAGG